MKNTLRAILALMAVVIVVLVAPAQTASADVYGWKWAGTVHVYDGTGGSGQAKVAEAAQEFSKARGLELAMVSDPAQAEIVVYYWNLSNANLGGLAYVENLTITNGIASGQCRVELNEWYQNKPFMEAVALHEMGHCIGMDHDTSRRGSIMDVPINNLDFYTKPTSWDYTQLSRLYTR